MPKRRSRLRRILGFALLAIGVIVVVVILNALAGVLGLKSERLRPEAVSSLLRPYDRVIKPEGDGPFPTALLFSGCDGPMDNMDTWAAPLVEKGWAVVVVDSHTPRGFDDPVLWRLVCFAQLMPGGERAGDVLVSVADAAQMPFVDPDRLAVIGMSHGGWSIMDLMAFDLPQDLPFNLRAMPQMPARGLGAIRAVILVYPWCGIANRARHEPWTQDAPIHFILATDDTIAPADDCLEVVGELREAGRAVTTQIFDGVTHAFDQKKHGSLSALVFDEIATQTAINGAISVMEPAFTMP